MTLTVRIGSRDLHLATTARPGIVSVQAYRAGTGHALGGPCSIPFGEVTAEPLCVVSGDLASFREAVATGVADDPFREVEASAC